MIRNAQVTDIHELILLSKQFEEENITYGLAANTKETLEASIGNHFWVEEMEGRIVGYAFGKIRENSGLSVFKADDKYYFELEEIYIHIQYRDQGIGNELISTILQDLKRDGINRVIVSSANKDWERIFDFYSKNGFKMWSLTMYL